MANGSYSHQLHHHRHKNFNSNRSNKSFFLPMFCRLSINDAVKPAKLSDPSSSSISSSPDPSSPKISCIGQIKKRSTTTNHRLACRFSASTTARSSAVYTNLNYSKLRKLFSGRNLISPAIDAATISNHNSKCKCKRINICNGSVRRPISTKNKLVISSDDRDVRGVVVEELDPPLPVVKCHRGDHEMDMNLRKRRGIELKTLQIQQFQLSINHNTSTIDNRDVSVPPPPPAAAASSKVSMNGIDR